MPVSIPWMQLLGTVALVTLILLFWGIIISSTVCHVIRTYWQARTVYVSVKYRSRKSTTKEVDSEEPAPVRKENLV